MVLLGVNCCVSLIIKLVYSSRTRELTQALFKSILSCQWHNWLLCKSLADMISDYNSMLLNLFGY